MGISFIVIGGIVLLAAGLAIAFGGTRGLIAGIAVLALAVAGAAAVLLLGRSAPPPMVIAVPAAPVRIVPAPPPVEEDTLLPADSWTLTGRILRGATGEEGFADAVVEVYDPATPPPFGAARTSSVSGADGAFTVAGLLKKKVRLRASAKGFVPVVAGADEGGVPPVLRLLPATPVSGRVFDGKTDTPVPGARVTVGEAEGTVADEKGAFRLEGVPRGRVSLLARAKGFVREREWIEVGAGPVEGVEIRLTPGAGVSGTVFGPDGKPRAGALVTIESAMKVPFAGEVQVPVDAEALLSGEDGAWRCDEVPADRTLSVRAAVGDLIAAPVEAGPLPRGEEEKGVDLRLSPGAAVLATVLDGKGAPVAGVTVAVGPVDEKEEANFGMMTTRIRRDGASAVTDAAGVARVGPVAPGPVKVKADHPDYRSAEQVVVTGAGKESALTLVMDAGSSLLGKVVDATGAPLAGASVTVTRFGGGAMVRQTRASDDAGAFRIGGLDGGSYMLRADLQGYVPTSLNGVSAGAEAITITLELGGTIVGVVTDAAGAPVPKFSVKQKKDEEGSGTNPMDWGNFAEQMNGSPFEDAGGAFRIEGVQPGSWSLEVLAEGLAPGRAGKIAVRAGSETEVAVTLPEGLVLRGVVVRRGDGAPVGGARVRIPAEGMMGEFDMGFDESALEGFEDLDEGGDMARMGTMFGGGGRGTASTGVDGRFELRGLEAGTVKLMASATGYAPLTVRGVEVPSREDLRIEVAEEAAVEGIVTDATGAPKVGAMVMIQRIPTFMRFGNTDERGHYRVGGLAAGSYLFYVMENGAAGMGGGGGMNLKSEPISVQEGKTLRKDYRVGEGIRVTGRVTRGAEPVGSVMVMMLPASAAGPMGVMGGAGAGFAMGSTQEDGTFTITGVNPGRYTISVQTGMGGAPTGGDPIDVPKGSTEIRHDIRLPETGIRGLVVDESGKPVVGATVSAVLAGKDLTHVSDIGAAMESMGGQAFTDDEGRFALNEVKPGIYRLQVQADGYPTKTVDDVSAVQAGPEVRIVVPRGEEAVVRVVGSDGAAVRGAAVFVADAEGRELTNMRQFDAVRTGDDGRCTVRVPAGRLRFEARSKGLAPGETTADIPGGEVVIRLAKGAALKVTVTGSGGGPLAGAGVELLDAGGNPLARRISMEDIADLLGGASTGADGLWTASDLPAGSWKVRAGTPDGKRGEVSVTLQAGETVEVTVRLD